MTVKRVLRGLVAAVLVGAGVAHGATLEDLVRAYPDFLVGVDGNTLVWRDGTRMPLGAPQPPRPMEDMLERGTIREQLMYPYQAGGPAQPLPGDPGRIRNEAFFEKMYGDCRAGQVAPSLVPVTWLPGSYGRTVRVTSINGIDRHLAAVSRDLDALPASLKRYLYPIGGTYACRVIAGTEQTSMHSYAAAIDINTGFSDYWRWRHDPGGGETYRNRIPLEIVDIFERHGFIWGGRWSHYDTMHFEYRPELLGFQPGRDE